MYSLFPSSLLFSDAIGVNQMVVEGTSLGNTTPSRIGSIAKIPQGAFVRITEYSQSGRKPKLVAHFRAHNVDQALAMVQGHPAMGGLELRTVY